MASVNLTSLYGLLTTIQGDVDRWCDHLAAMMESRFPTVRRFAGQIMQLQEAGRDGFTAPLSTLLTAFRFMQDPRMAKAISSDDFSLQDLCDRRRKLRIQIIIPIDYIEIWSPAIRLLIGSAIQHKLRAVEAPTVSVLIDECGQLGHFNSVRELYTFGRGAKLFGMCAWQEVSQLYKSFGHQGANEIIGSAQYRVFKGVRTLESARLISAMAGTMTLDYDAEVEQSNARRQKEQAIANLLGGGDMLEAAAMIRHNQMAERHRTKQARQLFTPDEVLNLPPSQMLAFASGVVDGVITGHWPRYFEQRRLAGRYLPNPYHDAERVRIASRFGTKTREVVHERVPAALAHLPQYRSGTWSYIEGYRPRIK